MTAYKSRSLWCAEKTATTYIGHTASLNTGSDLRAQYETRGGIWSSE